MREDLFDALPVDGCPLRAPGRGACGAGLLWPVADVAGAGGSGAGRSAAGSGARRSGGGGPVLTAAEAGAALGAGLISGLQAAAIADALAVLDDAKAAAWRLHRADGRWTGAAARGFLRCTVEHLTSCAETFVDLADTLIMKHSWECTRKVRRTRARPTIPIGLSDRPHVSPARKTVGHDESCSSDGDPGIEF